MKMVTGLTQWVVFQQNLQRLLLLHPSEAHLLIIRRTEITLRVIGHDGTTPYTQR